MDFKLGYRNMVKYSFIVPMYNVEAYVQECMNSILAQDYDNYEIILVNDGSTDSTEEKCQIYKEDKHVKYFRKENGGLSDARNYGIGKSSGEYLFFIDSDDFYGEVFLKNLNKIVSESKPDVLILNSYKYYEERKKRFISHPISRVSGIDIMLKNGIFKACAWDKVIKRSFLTQNNLFFPYKLLSEDILWCGELIKHNPSIIYYELPVYSYRQRNGSISKTVTPKHIHDIFLMVDNLLCDNVSHRLLKYLSFEYASLLLNLSLLDKSYCKSQRKLYYKYDYILKYAVSKKARLVSIIYKIFGYNTTCSFLRIFNRIRMHLK